MINWSPGWQGKKKQLSDRQVKLWGASTWGHINPNPNPKQSLLTHRIARYTPHGMHVLSVDRVDSYSDQTMYEQIICPPCS